MPLTLPDLKTQREFRSERRGKRMEHGIPRPSGVFHVNGLCPDATRGRNGFDGGVEAGIASGCAQHP